MSATGTAPLPLDGVPSIAEPVRPGRTWGDRLAPLLANKLALFGAILSLCFLGVATVGLAIVVRDEWNHLYLDQNVRLTLVKPFSEDSLLGTDNLGRSIAWRVVAGTGISLYLGLAVTALSMAVGMAMGSASGYFGGAIDRVVTGLIDLIWGFPVILVAVIFVGMLERGLSTVILAIAVVNWAGFARIVRAQTMSLKQRAFVEAAQALGVPDWKIILRHLVPNMLGTSLVMASYYIAVTVIAEAGLAFIGLGAQPPTPSLGQMISQGQGYLYNAAFVAIIPGVTIAALVLALNTLGDGLRDIFDPRLRRW